VTAELAPRLARSGPAAVVPKPWWQTGVVYHIYPRSFVDTNGDGVGDLRGIVEQLDYLNDGTPNSLGVSAIWLSPIYLSPGRDGGYDVADHTTIDPMFGTLEDFDVLVAEARRRSIHVVVDLVLNHTSDLHPWFRESRSTRAGALSDWYVWRDARPGGRTPNNWRSFFGGPAWTFDPEREQYYLHTFLPEQPDLNWHHPDVRGAAAHIIDFWIERGVSGFRLDVFNAYFKHPELLDNPRRPARSAWRRQRHIYNKDRPELREFLGELRAKLDEHPEIVAIGETFDGDAELAASYCEQLHMAFNFELLEQPWRAERFQRAVARWDSLLSLEHTWPSYVLSNHDNPRHASRLSRNLPAQEQDARAKVAAALLLTLRGTPFLYYGEEIGMNDCEVPRDEQHDLQFGRDGARSPMQWTDELYAGFARARPWLPVASDYQCRNVTQQNLDPRSVLSFYRRLIWLRNGSRALTLGAWTPLLDKPREALAYMRTSESQRMLIVLNFTNETVRLSFGGRLPTRRWIPRLSTRRPDVGWSLILDQELTLGPYEATIFEAADPA
jgi:alpha-glucosidase